jgi:hypothetical protein
VIASFSSRARSLHPGRAVRDASAPVSGGGLFGPLAVGPHAPILCGDIRSVARAPSAVTAVLQRLMSLSIFPKMAAAELNQGG